jgi:tyrosyl-tRNA synthetase
MLAAECYKQRMEKGLTFLEFNYMIMQSYDFYVLYQKYGCRLQCGGDDQWSNMLGGTDLIRRKLGENAYAMTITLLLTSEGKKMGKTQAGAVWLDPNKTSPFDFYQYWRNVDDADVINCMKLLTFMPLEEIESYSALEGSSLNKAKEALAYELTKMVHSEADAEEAMRTARALFTSGGDLSNMPSTEIDAQAMTEGTIGIAELLLCCGLCSSKSDARRNIEQGGVEADGRKIFESGEKITADALQGEGIVIKKGKKHFHRVYLSGGCR